MRIRKIVWTQCWLGLLIALHLLLPTDARPQADLSSRRAAAERYEATMPIAKMIDESIQQMALSLPDGQRSAFVAQVGRAIDEKQLRLIALDKMVEVFSAEELDALASFYGSPVGQSIVTKFPVYMAEVMPLVQVELARAVRELEGRPR